MCKSNLKSEINSLWLHEPQLLSYQDNEYKEPPTKLWYHLQILCLALENYYYIP